VRLLGREFSWLLASDPMKFRFSIRDLLWLTLVMALAVGWWIDRQRSDARCEKQLDELTPEKIETVLPYKVYPPAA
jgi:hypothetical protein